MFRTLETFLVKAAENLSNKIFCLGLVRQEQPPSPLQPVERPAESALEGGGKGHWMESGQMPACANL